jgi:superfamily II DNA or RNA helicase
VSGKSVDNYLKYAPGKRALVFAITIEHAQEIARRYRMSGISAAALDSTSPSRERVNTIERFRRGDITVLCNVQLFTEGFDLPEIEVVQLCRPTQSVALHMQMVGRALRPKSDGAKAIILDHAGNCARLGTPSAHRRWTLQGLRSIADESSEGVKDELKKTSQEKPKSQAGTSSEFKLVETEEELIPFSLTPNLDANIAQRAEKANAEEVRLRQASEDEDEELFTEAFSRGDGPSVRVRGRKRELAADLVELIWKDLLSGMGGARYSSPGTKRKVAKSLFKRIVADFTNHG